MQSISMSTQVVKLCRRNRHAQITNISDYVIYSVLTTVKSLRNKTSRDICKDNELELVQELKIDKKKKVLNVCNILTDK